MLGVLISNIDGLFFYDLSTFVTWYGDNIAIIYNFIKLYNLSKILYVLIKKVSVIKNRS